MIVNLAGNAGPTEYLILQYPLDGPEDFVLMVPGDPASSNERTLPFLKSDDQFWITGRGPVFSFKHNPMPELWDPDMMRGKWVFIDGGLYLITGVESFRPMISPTNPYGDRPVGLLVRARTDLPRGYLLNRALLNFKQATPTG